MTKKKLKKLLRRAQKEGFGAKREQDYGGFGAGGDAWDGAGDGQGYGYGQGYGASAPKGLLSGLGLPRGFASGQTEQFILGALLGGAAAYVLADEELRSKLVKSVMKLYAGLTGGIEEFKEQMADLKAEVEAEHGL